MMMNAGGIRDLDREHTCEYCHKRVKGDNWVPRYRLCRVCYEHFCQDAQEPEETEEVGHDKTR